MTNNKIVLLTGSSRGLGRATAKNIAAFNEPITLLATSRKAENLNLKGTHKDTIIEYPQLDILDKASIDSLYNDIVKKYGRVDVLINNAGSTFEESDNSTFGPEAVKKTFDLNYYAVVNTIEKFIPIIPAGGRVVNLSSQASHQADFPNADLKARIFDNKLTIPQLNALAKEYESASNNTDGSDGWLKDGFYPAYGTSKAFVNFLTACEARAHPEIKFNALCPGTCATELASGLPEALKTKTADEGTRLILRLGFGDIDNVNGKFWAGRSTADTGPGHVIENWSGGEITWDYKNNEVPTALFTSSAK
ncbi:uncharacterized protein L201_000945 [Kwoniella dendrophila CBS 6074]|uniref:Short-chain dehydrogenase/reductase SDR n=1 Tax=Kwoniella dendrophila CBS 6074 TaxID=1295534 RepID=A0AAX4JMG4_9TREE